MNIFYVYQLCSSEYSDLPFYVGKGKDDRMYIHEQVAIRSIKPNCRNKYLRYKILKIKRNGYQIVYRKIANNLSEQDAFTIEKDMIAFNRRLGFKLCNYTDGGEGSSGYHTTRSLETRKKLSISHIGKPGTIGMKGKHHSEETKKKQSENNKGKHNKPKPPFTKEHKLNISLSAKNKPPFTNEHKLHMKEALDH